MTKNEVKKKINQHRTLLKEEYHVKKVGIFGSVARGEQNKTSDIDILVELNSPIGFFAFIRLEKTLSRFLNKKVDLVTKKALKPAIKKEIMKELIYV